MTKEITKAVILQEIQDKFALREFEREIFTFSEKVLPTYDIGQHLMKWETMYKEKTISSAAGIDFFVVPDDERWHITNYNIVFLTGNFTVSGLYVSRHSAHNVDICYLDLTAGQNVSYAKNLPQPLILEPTDRLYILIDGYTSSGNLRLYINVLKESVR